MQFAALQAGRLERRYKRFLADVRLPDGEMVTAHCPNTGAMTGCAEPGSRVWLSPSSNPRRKLAWTLELVETIDGLVCVHSALANRVVAEALEAGIIGQLAGFDDMRKEVPYGLNSRADFSLIRDGRTVMIEVKAVTLYGGAGLGQFPDAVSLRARKHLAELEQVVESGARAVLIFCSLHDAVNRISPAHHIDPTYADAVVAVQKKGVEIYGLGVRVSSDGIAPTHEIPVVHHSRTEKTA